MKWLGLVLIIALLAYLVWQLVLFVRDYKHMKEIKKKKAEEAAKKKDNINTELGSDSPDETNLKDKIE